MKPKNILVEHIKDSVVSVSEDGVLTQNNGFLKAKLFYVLEYTIKILQILKA